MTYEVIFSSGAEEDLAEIEQYLAMRFSERNAQRYVQKIVAHCRSLALAPYRGTKRDHIRIGLRTIGFERRITIVFEVMPETIIIAGVFYAGRRFDADLK